MKNYSLKTKANFRRKSNLSTSLKILLIVGLLIVVLYLFGSAIGFVTAFITKPMYAAREWILESGATVPSYFRSRNELLEEMKTLRQQLAASASNQAQLTRALHENEELRALLNTNETDRIGAGVIARPPFLPYDSLLIDRGSADGIAEGAIVYHNNDVAIGYVRKAFRGSALVTLFSTSGVKATAYIYGPNIYATAYGNGGGVIRLSVPQGIEIHEGDVVAVPSLEVGIIGRITEIRSVATEPEQHAFVVPNTSMQSLHLVTVSRRTIEEVTFEEAEALVGTTSPTSLMIDVPDAYLLGSDVATSSATSTATTTNTNLSE